MAPTVKKTSRSTNADQAGKSVVFAQDEADKALLEAIEQELGAQHFENFSALCKEALQQFFRARQEPTISPGIDNSVEIQLTQQIIQLQQQLTAIEHTLSHPVRSDQETDLFEQVRQQLNSLHQQIEHMENSLPQSLVVAVNQPLTQFQQQISNLEQALSAKDANQFDEMQNQVARLTLQIDRLEAARIPTPGPESEESSVTSLLLESNLQAEHSQPLPSADPLLNRLSTLLEEF